MNEDEKDHINKHLPELISRTTCNVVLLSILLQRKVLSENDRQDVQYCRTPLEKSQRLYEILPKKQGAYEILKASLKETMQTGAALILEQLDSNFQDFGLISVDTNQIIGKGRSTVYRGQFNGREVAVKVIQEMPEQALKEVNFLKELDDHENIVRYFIAELKNSQVYIALELCLINLADEMKIKLVKPDPTNVLFQCTRGLAFLHKNGVIHRDLKPANILLNRHGQVKISDFGFSKQLDAGLSAASVSGMCGTLDWMAPEILGNIDLEERCIIDARTTVKTDIFSLGCIYYYVLSSGQHLFGKQLQRANNIVNDAPQWDFPQLDYTAKELIVKMISWLPIQRPTAEEALCSEYFHKFHGGQYTQKDYSKMTHQVEQMCISDEKIKMLANKSVSTPTNPTNFVKRRNDLIDAVIKDSMVFRTQVNQIRSNMNAPLGGINLLLYAARFASVETLSALVEFGCDWSLKGKYGETVLHYAARGGNFEAVKYFVALGADIEAGFGIPPDTPIVDVLDTKNNFMETLHTFLNLGANISGLNGQKLILRALKCGRSMEELQEIVKVGANWKDCDVLHTAAEAGNIEAVKYFISLGAKVNTINKHGDAPVHRVAYSYSKNQIQMLNCLLENGADINALDERGRTVLAIAKSFTENPKELLDEIIKLGGK